MNKKLISVFGMVAVFCMALVLAGCAGGSTSASSTATSSESGETTNFVVGFDQSYPPYGFVGDNGAYTGFDLELAQAVCEKNGWALSLEPIDWSAKDAMIDAGTITCIWNGFTIEGREDNYTFSEPYMLNGQVVVTRADSDISSLNDLAGKTVITQLDSAALDVLEGDRADLAASFASLETIADYNTAFMMLQAGQVDAVACDLSIAEYNIAANPGAYVQLEESLSDEHYGVGFKKGNTEIAEEVNAALRQLNDEGFIEELCNKYAEYGISYENWLIK